MILPPRTRTVILMLGLAATLGAAFIPDPPQPARSSAVVSAAPRSVLPPPVDIPAIAIQRLETSNPERDPFSPNAWRPAPPPVQQTPPSPPVAPLFPYAYLGRVDDAGRASVLLGRADRSLTVQDGDLIDGVWRVERIVERTVDLLYQPLGQRVTLAVGSES